MNQELLLNLILEGILLLAKRANGENISNDLTELQTRVRSLIDKEKRIAAGDITALGKK